MSALSHRVTAVMVIALATSLASASPAATQSSKPPRDPANIERKARRSAELQQQALQALDEPAKAERLVGNAYTQLKAAQDDMIVNATVLGSSDPILILNSRKVDQALSLLIGAWDALKTRNQGGGVEDAVEAARGRLQQALRLTNALLATGF